MANGRPKDGHQMAQGGGRFVVHRGREMLQRTRSRPSTRQSGRGRLQCGTKASGSQGRP
jgi:hypothetical protein